MEQPVYCTGISIKPHYSFAYTFRLDKYGRQGVMPRKHHHLTELSAKARRRIITAMQWMLFLSPKHSTYCKIQKKKFKFSINFITLTLSDVQAHSDKYIVHKMLRPMLKYLRRKGCTMYLWKAETQDNGNLHFHITTNHYIYWRSLRNKWNSLQHRHGYLKKFFETNGDMDANSTDVHAVKSTKSIISYMTKYMLKADRFKKNPSKKYNIPKHYYSENLNQMDGSGRAVKRHIECALWNSSTELSKYTLNISEEETEFTLMQEWIEKNSKKIKCDRGTLYEYNDQNKFSELFQMFEESNFNLS